MEQLLIPISPIPSPSPSPRNFYPNLLAAMVCGLCGDSGHNTRTCPMGQEDDHSRRGKRESPRTTVTETGRLAILRDISKKLSPKPQLPPLPEFQGMVASGSSEGTELTMTAAAEENKKSEFDENKQDGKKPEADEEPDKMKAMMKKMMGMIGKLSDDMLSVSSGIDEAKQTAAKAVAIAEKTDVKVTELQNSCVTKEVVQSMIDKAIADKVEKKISYIDQQKKGASDLREYNTVIIGGLECSSLVAAETWAKSKLTQKNAALPTKMYAKGDIFKGFLWLQFDGTEKANDALSAMKEALKNDTEAWCNFDLPIEQRVVNSVLFGMKAQLVAWKLPKKYLNVDTDTDTITAGGKDIVRASVVGDTLSIEWIAADWAQWEELQQSPEIDSIIAKAREKLAQSSKEMGKGAGKGP